MHSFSLNESENIHVRFKILFYKKECILIFFEYGLSEAEAESSFQEFPVQPAWYLNLNIAVRPPTHEVIFLVGN